MSYTELVGSGQVSIAPPPGSIMAYLSSNTPDGWVLLDGVQQTNTNGKFNRVHGLGIGSMADNNTKYTPPNYKGAFLRGTGTATINSNYVAPALGQYQDSMIQEHNHVGGSHSHGIHMWGDDSPGQKVYGLIANGQNTMNSQDGDNIEAQPNLNEKVYIPRNTQAATASVGNIQGIPGYNIGGQTTPFNFGVNWIMKL